jgi:hypothetical protein
MSTDSAPLPPPPAIGDEIERLKTICRAISELINTSPYLFQEPVDHQKVLDEIEDLAVSGYAPQDEVNLHE